MTSRGLRGPPDRVFVGAKVAPNSKKGQTVAKALDDKIQAIEETEAEAAHQFSSFSTDAKPMGGVSAPKTPRRPGRPSEGRLSSGGAVHTPTRDEQASRASRATPSKNGAPVPSSVLRPTAASLMRQQSNVSGTPTRANSTPVKPVRTPLQARSSPFVAKTPQMRSTPTRSVPPPAVVRATPSRSVSARSTPTRAAPAVRSIQVPSAAAAAPVRKTAVPSAQESRPGVVEGRSDARSLLETREELQRVMNVLLQAVLANAKASGAARTQECKAEAELFTDWNQLEVLRKELASAQHKLARDTHTLDLRMLLQAQAEQAVQASEWLPQFVASYGALSRALEHTTHLMPAPNSVYSAPTVLAAFQETSCSLQQLQRVSLQTSNVPQVSSTVARLAAVLSEEESELCRLQELLAMHAQLENYERSLRIQAIQNALPPVAHPPHREHVNI